MSRRHPYFSQINRLEAIHLAMSGPSCGCAPRMTADEQRGVLWQTLREAAEPA